MANISDPEFSGPLTWNVSQPTQITCPLGMAMRLVQSDLATASFELRALMAARRAA